MAKNIMVGVGLFFLYLALIAIFSPLFQKTGISIRLTAFGITFLFSVVLGFFMDGYAKYYIFLLLLFVSFIVIYVLQGPTSEYSAEIPKNVLIILGVTIFTHGLVKKIKCLSGKGRSV